MMAMRAPAMPGDNKSGSSLKPYEHRLLDTMGKEVCEGLEGPYRDIDWRTQMFRNCINFNVQKWCQAIHVNNALYPVFKFNHSISLALPFQIEVNYSISLALPFQIEV
ncbi:hypothetical protein XELAEV_18037244mg [Xenopus laevis]|uniref:Uncharacterized protein n=1 Tax=Xenopus laevis TaxID=8355 RepID=A0A974CD14_XENLA|nr:hypothetical protein XELAEV_18037244mg [Xenopus laevis]